MRHRSGANLFEVTVFLVLIGLGLLIALPIAKWFELGVWIGAIMGAIIGIALAIFLGILTKKNRGKK